MKPLVRKVTIGSTTVMIGSMWLPQRRGLKLARPWRVAVGSPSLAAALAWPISWRTRETRTRGRMTIGLMIAVAATAAIGSTPKSPSPPPPRPPSGSERSSGPPSPPVRRWLPSSSRPPPSSTGRPVPSYLSPESGVPFFDDLEDLALTPEAAEDLKERAGAEMLPKSPSLPPPRPPSGSERSSGPPSPPVRRWLPSSSRPPSSSTGRPVPSYLSPESGVRSFLEDLPDLVRKDRFKPRAAATTENADALRTLGES